MATTKSNSSDLKDSAKDAAKLKPDSTIIDLPEVKDIPGQENIKPAPFGELADNTISSADEEADDLFNDNLTAELDNDPASNVTSIERDDLRKAANDMPTEDDIHLREAALDNVDDDGTPLNEGSFKNNISASDLDVPGAGADDADEDIGEEDEENNEYSLGGENHDDTIEDNY